MSTAPLPGPGPWPRRALLIGYGVSGRAAARWLARQGCRLTVLEDKPDRASAARYELASGADVVSNLGPDEAARQVSSVDWVVPSPGVPPAHPVVVAALSSGVPVVGEVEMAWRLVELKRSQTGGRGAVAAITGTNGKTTVTELASAMLNASGVTAIAAGNVGFPMLEAAQAWDPDGGEAVVAEVSSFQLQYSETFAPDVSCWLNFSPDHLDWHYDLEHYRAAKARIWAHQRPGTTAVVNADDPVVRAAAREVPAGVAILRFGTGGAGVEWRVRPDGVEGPGGLVLQASELPRSFPHDLTNVAAAAAVAMAAGATAEGCKEAALSLPLPAHRVQRVGEGGGVTWYDDSKATTPASVLAAVAGLASVVLVAGGRNKGLDLSVLARAVPPVRAVVAIGESAPEVVAAFSGLVPTVRAASMAEAVQSAATLARPGDAVLLSPGCASFDWYSSYAERGDHFSALARQKANQEPAPGGPGEEARK